MNREIKYITDNMNKLSLQERYDICKLIEFYDGGKLNQTNNGVYVLFKNLQNETLLNVYESVKIIKQLFFIFLCLYIFENVETTKRQIKYINSKFKCELSNNEVRQLWK